MRLLKPAVVIRIIDAPVSDNGAGLEKLKTLIVTIKLAAGLRPALV